MVMVDMFIIKNILNKIILLDLKLYNRNFIDWSNKIIYSHFLELKLVIWFK